MFGKHGGSSTDDTMSRSGELRDWFLRGGDDATIQKQGNQP